MPLEISAYVFECGCGFGCRCGSVWYMTHPDCCVCAVCTASRTLNELDVNGTRFLPEIRSNCKKIYLILIVVQKC